MKKRGKFQPEDIAEMCRLRRDGQTMREIAEKFNTDAGTISRRIKEVSASAVGDAVASNAPRGGMRGPPPSKQPIDVPIDKMDVDGSIDILKLDRPATPEELAELCKVDLNKWVPQYYKVNTWQGAGKFKEPGGDTWRKVQLYQSNASFKRIFSEQLEDAILRFARENIKPLPKPKINIKPVKYGQMVVAGWYDAHIGLYCWNAEVGADYDTGIAVQRLCHSIDDTVRELTHYPVEHVVIPVGNDFMHFDSNRMTTAMGEHHLDADTRFARIYNAGLHCFSYKIERFLEMPTVKKVRLFYVPGNHDQSPAYTLLVTLAQRYRNDPRVEVCLSPNPRKYVVYGGTIIGFDHGHACKPNQYPLIFGVEAKEYWSASTYREVQVGHLHQRWQKDFVSQVPTNNLTVRRNPCMCEADYWHHKQGLISEPVKSMEAWRYDKVAYRGSHVAWVRGGDHPVGQKIMDDVNDLGKQVIEIEI